MAGQVGYFSLGPPFINNAPLSASIDCENFLTMVLFIQWYVLDTDSTITSMNSRKHRDYK